MNQNNPASRNIPEARDTRPTVIPAPKGSNAMFAGWGVRF